MVFTILRILCHHHHCVLWDYFHHPQRNSISLNSHSPILTLSRPWQPLSFFLSLDLPSLLFYLLIWYLLKHKSFSFLLSSFTNLLFCCVFGVIFKKLLPNSISQRFTLIFFFLEFYNLALTCRSVVHFKVMFVFGSEIKIQIHFLHYAYPVALAPFIERIYFSDSKVCHWQTTYSWVLNFYPVRQSLTFSLVFCSCSHYFGACIICLWPPRCVPSSPVWTPFHYSKSIYSLYWLLHNSFNLPGSCGP